MNVSFLHAISVNGPKSQNKEKNRHVGKPNFLLKNLSEEIKF